MILLNKILSIIKYDLIKYFRDKSAIIFVFILPAVFALIFSFMFGNVDVNSATKIPIGVVNLDNNGISEAIIDDMKVSKTYLIFEMTEEELRKAVTEKRIEIGFIFENDFSESVEKNIEPKVRAVKLPGTASYTALKSTLEYSFQKYNVKNAIYNYLEEKTKGKENLDASKKGEIKAIKNNSIEQMENMKKSAEKIVNKNLELPDKMTVTREDGKSVIDLLSQSKTRSVIGILIMFAMYNLIYAASSMKESFEENMYMRINVAPIQKSIITASKAIVAFLKGWIQFMVMIVLSSVLGVDWGDNVLGMVVLLSVFIVSSIAMGLLIAVISKTNAQLVTYSNLIIMTTSMISGCWWSVDMEPEFMQKIATILPQYWVLKGAEQLIFENRGILDIWQNFAVLLLIGFVFFVLGTVLQNVRKRYAE